jgi:LytR cell envelope-related transcriptional attenuator
VEHVQPFQRPFPRNATALATGLLVAVALLVGAGFALLHRQSGADAAARTARVPKGKIPSTPLRSRSRISVLVLNGNGIEGAAGGKATDMLAIGYGHVVAGDAPNLDYARSLVLYRPGWQREAQRLSVDAGIPTVAPLDGRPTSTYAHVPLLLILGAN